MYQKDPVVASLLFLVVANRQTSRPRPEDENEHVYTLGMAKEHATPSKASQSPPKATSIPLLQLLLPVLQAL